MHGDNLAVILEIQNIWDTTIEISNPLFPFVVEQENCDHKSMATTETKYNQDIFNVCFMHSLHLNINLTTFISTQSTAAGIRH